MSDLYIGAYWGPRKESAEQCADRLLACLEGLKATSSLFARWYEKGISRRDALNHAVEIQSREVLIRLVKSGRHVRDADSGIIEDLGFEVGMWNGEKDERAVSLSVGCGLYAQNLNLRNSVVLDFPEHVGDLAFKEHALNTLRVVVTAWEPEWAGIISRSSRNSRPFTAGSAFVDWMIYLSQLDVAESQLPAGASLIRIDGLGGVVISQDEPIDVSNPKHLQNVQAIEAVLFHRKS